MSYVRMHACAVVHSSTVRMNQKNGRTHRSALASPLKQHTTRLRDRSEVWLKVCLKCARTSLSVTFARFAWLESGVADLASAPKQASLPW